MGHYTPCVTTRRYLKLSPHPSLKNTSVHSGCLHNEVRSLEGRVLRPTYMMDRKARRCLSLIATEWAASLPSLPYFPMDGQLFLFPQHRRRAYSAGLLSLLDAPLSQADAHISAFVKCEKIEIQEKNGDPRMIQARSIRWNLELGRYTRVIEHTLYKLQSSRGLRLVAKGRNPRERARDLAEKWGTFKRPVALSLDLHRWDMHCRRGLLVAVARFYLGLVPSEYLKWLLESMLDNKGRTHNGAKYSREDGVTSGDMTTALGNCLAVLLILRLLRLIRANCTTGLGVSHGKLRGVLAGTKTALWSRLEELLMNCISDFEEYDDGDDHVFMCEEEDAIFYKEALEIVYGLCGHKLTVEGQASELDQVTFCQHKPMMVGGCLMMVSNPRKTLANAFMASTPHLADANSARAYFAQVFLGRSIVHAGEPYIGPMFQRLSREFPCSDSVIETPQFRMQFSGMWLNTRHLRGEDLRAYVTSRNESISAADNNRYCEIWGIEHEIMCGITEDPLPALSGPKRGYFHAGGGLDLYIDTITEMGILPELR